MNWYQLLRTALSGLWLPTDQLACYSSCHVALVQEVTILLVSIAALPHMMAVNIIY